MKSIIFITFGLVAIAVAVPLDENFKILRSDFRQQPEGSYEFSIETDNGILRNEKGELKEVFDEENKPHNVVVVRGSYSFVSGHGEGRNTINYYADETGYHAEGGSI